MPLYDVACDACGVHEVFSPMARAHRLHCPSCGRPCRQVFTPERAAYASIVCGAEDSTNSARIAEGTAAWNMGLPGVEQVVGTRSDGKPKLSYRPVSNAEVSTARSLRERAKRAGLQSVATKRALGGR